MLRTSARAMLGSLLLATAGCVTELPSDEPGPVAPTRGPSDAGSASSDERRACSDEEECASPETSPNARPEAFDAGGPEILEDESEPDLSEEPEDSSEEEYDSSQLRTRIPVGLEEPEDSSEEEYDPPGKPRPPAEETALAAPHPPDADVVAELPRQDLAIGMLPTAPPSLRVFDSNGVQVPGETVRDGRQLRFRPLGQFPTRATYRAVFDQGDGSQAREWQFTTDFCSQVDPVRTRAVSTMEGCPEFLESGLECFSGERAIQRAIDSLPEEGGLVCIAAGHYPILNRILVPSHVELRGDTQRSVIRPARSYTCAQAEAPPFALVQLSRIDPREALRYAYPQRVQTDCPDLQCPSWEDVPENATDVVFDEANLCCQGAYSSLATEHIFPTEGQTVRSLALFGTGDPECGENGEPSCSAAQDEVGGKCDMGGGREHGVALFGTVGALILHNHIRDVRSDGVFLGGKWMPNDQYAGQIDQSASDSLIAHNLIERSRRGCIVLINGNRNFVAHNVCRESGDYGVDFENNFAWQELRENEIRRNVFDGVGNIYEPEDRVGPFGIKFDPRRRIRLFQGNRIIDNVIRGVPGGRGLYWGASSHADTFCSTEPNLDSAEPNLCGQALIRGNEIYGANITFLAGRLKDVDGKWVCHAEASGNIVRDNTLIDGRIGGMFFRGNPDPNHPDWLRHPLGRTNCQARNNRIENNHFRMTDLTWPGEPPNDFPTPIRFECASDNVIAGNEMFLPEGFCRTGPFATAPGEPICGGNYALDDEGVHNTCIGPGCTGTDTDNDGIYDHCEH